jgi:hypothetical protein
MSDLGFTVIEYLIWVVLAIGLVVLLFVCLALGLAVFSAVNPLASKLKLISTAKKPRLPEPNRLRPIRFHSHRQPESSGVGNTPSESLAGRMEPPEVSSLPMRKAS